MSKQDFYELLGVEKNVSADDLKKAYRKKAMKYHPDRNPGDAEAEKKFKEVSHAYDILKNEQKRAAYDRYGHDAFEQGGGGGAGGFGGGQGGFDPNMDFADIFSDLFGDFMGGGGRGGAGAGAGAGRGRSAQARGSDLRYNLSVSLEEAYTGKQQKIQFTTAATCGSCKGSGSKNSSGPMTCGQCRGAGRTRVQQGFFTMERTCTACHGMGQVIKDPCNSCAGEGRVRKEKTLSVSIPEGVEEGTRIRLNGEGEVGLRGGPAGDLYIFVSIKPHQFFVREGNDIHCKVPVKMTTAALGGSIEVPSIEGKRARVTIPTGTQSGDQFRMKKKGMPVMRSGGRHGDMYIHCVVETPKRLTKKQKELLEEFESLDEVGAYKEAEGFFSKVKELWKEK